MKHRLASSFTLHMIHAPSGRPSVRATLMQRSAWKKNSPKFARNSPPVHRRALWYWRGGSYFRAAPFPFPGCSLVYPGPTLPSCLYSPECVEGVFSELRLYGVLRSALTSRLGLIDGVHLSEGLHPP